MPRKIMTKIMTNEGGVSGDELGALQMTRKFPPEGRGRPWPRRIQNPGSVTRWKLDVRLGVRLGVREPANPVSPDTVQANDSSFNNDFRTDKSLGGLVGFDDPQCVVLGG